MCLPIGPKCDKPSQLRAANLSMVRDVKSLVDSIQSGVTRRVESLRLIFTLFGFLWQFNRLDNGDLLSAAEQFQQQYDKEIPKISVMRSSSSNEYIPRTLNWIASQRNCFKKYSNFNSLGCFLALRIFVSLPASVALGERTFNTLK